MLAGTNYLGVTGTNAEARDGLFTANRRVRLQDVLDGTSQTLLLGERPPSPAPALDWGWWAWSAYDTALAAVDRRVFISRSCPNPAVYGPGATLANRQARRMYPQFEQIQSFDPIGRSLYHGM